MVAAGLWAARAPATASYGRRRLPAEVARHVRLPRLGHDHAPHVAQPLERVRRLRMVLTISSLWHWLREAPRPAGV